MQSIPNFFMTHISFFFSLSFCLCLWSSGAGAELAQTPKIFIPPTPPSAIAADSTAEPTKTSSGEIELEAAIKTLFKGRRTQARNDLYTALELVKRSGDNSLLGRAYYFIGIVESDFGFDAAARTAFSLARRLSQQEGELSLESFAVRGLADLEEEQGNLLQARELYQKAIELAQQGAEPKGLANALFGLANLEQRQNKTEAAIATMRSSLDTSKKANYKQGMVNAWTSLARFQLEAGALDGATKSYNSAYQLHMELRDRLGQARLKLGLGDLKKRQNKLKEARQFYEDAHLLYLAEQFALGQANAQLRLARLHAEHPKLSGRGNAGGRRKDAVRQVLNKAIDLYKTVDSPPGLPTAYCELAELEMGEQDYASAAKNYALAFEHYTARQDSAGQANVLKRLGFIRAVADEAAASAQAFHNKAAAAAKNNPVLAIQLWTKAEQQYKKSLAAMPKQPMTLTNWGLALTNWAEVLTRENLPDTGNLWSLALEKYDGALQLDSHFASAIFQKGVTLQLYADALELADAGHAKVLRHRAMTQYEHVLAQPEKLSDALAATEETTKTAGYSKMATKQQLAEILSSQTRPNTASELRHLRFGAANNWSYVLIQQAKTEVKNDLPAARALLQLSYAKSELALQIEPPGYSALNNWAAALMTEHWALLNTEPHEAAKVLLKARNLLLPAANLAPETLAYNLACTYALEARAEEAVFWLQKAMQAGDSIKQSDIVNDQDFNLIRQNPQFLAWFYSLKNTQK